VIFKTETLLRVECVGSRVISRFEISKDKVNGRELTEGRERKP
jgi:hypothetical protein